MHYYFKANVSFKWKTVNVSDSQQGKPSSEVDTHMFSVRYDIAVFTNIFSFHMISKVRVVKDDLFYTA